MVVAIKVLLAASNKPFPKGSRADVTNRYSISWLLSCGYFMVISSSWSDTTLPEQANLASHLNDRDPSSFPPSWAGWQCQLHLGLSSDGWMVPEALNGIFSCIQSWGRENHPSLRALLKVLSQNIHLQLRGQNCIIYHSQSYQQQRKF